MTAKPIESARDRDLRLSFKALQRAARRAHELAAQTGTVVIVSRNGVIEQIDPRKESQAAALHEQAAAYKDSQ